MVTQAVAGGVPPRAPVVPDWLTNLAALGWRLLAIIGLVTVAWLLAGLLWTVTASIAVATGVAALFAPWVLALPPRGRSGAVGIVWAGAIAAIAGVLLLLTFAFLPYVADIVTRLTASLQLLSDQLAALNLPPFVSALISHVADGIKSCAAGAAGGIVSSAAGTVTVLILAVFLVFFLLRDGDKAWQW